MVVEGTSSSEFSSSVIIDPTNGSIYILNVPVSRMLELNMSSEISGMLWASRSVAVSSTIYCLAGELISWKFA